MYGPLSVIFAPADGTFVVPSAFIRSTQPATPPLIRHIISFGHKSPTKQVVHLSESIFQTNSRIHVSTFVFMVLP